MSSQGDQMRRALGRAFADVRNDLALAISEAIDRRMPVDTGWARANTIPSIRAPAPEPGGDDVSSAEAAKAAAVASLLSDISGPAADAYVTNHVPYVPRLNKGYSSQAPGRFMEAAADAAIAEVAAGVAMREVKL